MDVVGIEQVVDSTILGMLPLIVVLLLQPSLDLILQLGAMEHDRQVAHHQNPNFKNIEHQYIDDISKHNAIICLFKLHYTKQLLPSPTKDCGQKMECQNWQGKEVVHFHLLDDCGMFLLVRTFNIFEPILKYFMHLNSFLNQDPTNLDTFFYSE